MTAWTETERVRRSVALVGRLRAAVADLLSQEFGYSGGHLTALLNGCVFAPSLLSFWLVNGVLDFSTAVAIGAVASPAGLWIRLLAYVLLVPAFLLVRAGFYLLHPVHRRTVLSGSCPTSQLLSLDWFSVGILATGLPLALQNLGPWLASNLTLLVGLFVVPRILPDAAAVRVKLAAVAVGVALFAYLNYGRAVGVGPPPGTALGALAGLTLTDATTARFLSVVNGLLTGPPLVAAFGLAMNRVLTRPELTDVPVVRHTLPRRDPDRIVATSAALGTLFYLLVVAVATGDVSLA
jgi:hypothetical protein